MATVTIHNTHLTNIANAIREKNGTSTKYKPSEMATAISNITTGGVEPTGTIDITENGIYDVTDYASANVSVASSGGGNITRGLVINSTDSDGYVTDASIVGMTELPAYYFYYASYYKNYAYTYLGKIGANLHLPNNLTRIYTYCFYYCSELALTTLPDSVKWIDDYAFAYNSRLALTKLPSSLLTIGMNGFYNCIKLAFTELPSALSNIGNNCFYGCTNLALTSLPAGLSSLGQSCFRDCSKLAITSIPSGITSLRQTTFRGCTSLTELTIEGNMTSIDANVFYGCSNLAKVVFPNVTAVPTLANTNAFSSTPIASGTGYIYLPDTLVETAKSESNWSTYANQIKGLSELEA